MKYNENPFYVLGASLYDNRGIIKALSDDKSLLSDTDKYTEASNILTNPQKRLSAEIRWFLGCPSEKALEISNYITNTELGKPHKPFDYSRLETITQLNICLYRFPYLQFKDPIKAIDAIMEISRLFDAISTSAGTEKIRSLINDARDVAKFPGVGRSADIASEIISLRREIKNRVSQKLNESRNYYIEVVNLISKKYLSDSNTRSAVIDDLLNEYELAIDSELNQTKQQIMLFEGKISNNTSDSQIEMTVANLIGLIKSWHRIAHPLLIRAQLNGTPHQKSEELAYYTRELAIDLHNDYEKTAQSLKLVTALQMVFQPLPKFAAKVKEDLKTLQKINARLEEEERSAKEILRRNRIDKQYLVTTHSNKITIPPLCTCCLQPTKASEKISCSKSQDSYGQRTTRTVTLDMPICQQCLTHRKDIKIRKWWLILLTAILGVASICVIGATIGSESDWLWVGPFIVATAVYLILGLIIKLPQRSLKHSTNEQSVWLTVIEMDSNDVTFTFTNWQYAKLFSNANNTSLSESTRRNRVKSTALVKGIDHPIGILILSLVVTGPIVFLFGNTLSKIL